MKIAVPVQDNNVEDHFGHCDYYAVFTTDENKVILTKELLKSTGGCGCKSNIAGILKEIGVEVLLAGNMGQGALNMLMSYDLEVVRGCSGNADDLIQNYLEGKLIDADILCDHHGENCNH